MYLSLHHLQHFLAARSAPCFQPPAPCSLLPAEPNDPSQSEVEAKAKTRTQVPAKAGVAQAAKCLVLGLSCLLFSLQLTASLHREKKGALY